MYLHIFILEVIASTSFTCALRRHVPFSISHPRLPPSLQAPCHAGMEEAHPPLPSSSHPISSPSSPLERLELGTYLPTQVATYLTGNSPSRCKLFSTSSKVKSNSTYVEALARPRKILRVLLSAHLQTNRPLRFARFCERYSRDNKGGRISAKLSPIISTLRGVVDR